MCWHPLSRDTASSHLCLECNRMCTQCSDQSNSVSAPTSHLCVGCCHARSCFITDTRVTTVNTDTPTERSRVRSRSLCRRSSTPQISPKSRETHQTWPLAGGDISVSAWHRAYGYALAARRSLGNRSPCTCVWSGLCTLSAAPCALLGCARRNTTRSTTSS